MAKVAIQGRRYRRKDARKAANRLVSSSGLKDERVSVLHQIRERLHKLENGREMPKHAQLRRAILASIRDRILRPGDQLPPEQVIAAEIGLSHGTVRRALEQLGAGGILSREHGRGTFISKQHILDDIWHLRFHADNDSPVLPIYARILDRRIVRQPGPWANALGHDPKGYVLIKRSYDVDHRFVCYTEFYIQASRFGRMATCRIRDLEKANLKKFINDRYGLPTLYASQRVRLETLSREVCRIMSQDQDAVGLLLEVVSYTEKNVPLSFHLIRIPQTNEMLDLSLRGLSSRVPPA